MIALLLATLLAVAPADTTLAARTLSTECPGGQTLTAADLRAAGLVYPSDIVRVLDGLRTTTVDGFAWHPFSGGGVPFGARPFLVLIDGEPWTMNGLGESILKALPVPLVDIAEVSWCPDPGLIAGQWADQGVLHLRTFDDAPGTTTRGAWQIGNETGDPGPYRYTDLGTPNVDKSGPDGEVVFAASDSVRQGRMTLGTYRFYATDPALFTRAFAVTTGITTNLRVITASLDGETTVLGGRVGGHLTGRYDSDLWFFEPSGRELPVRRLDARLGLSTEQSVGRGRLDARLGLDLQRLDDEQSELPGFHPGWHSRTATATLAYRMAPDGSAPTLGARLVRTEASGPGLGDQGAGFTLGRVYAQHPWRITGGAVLESQVAVAVAEGRIGVNGRQGFRYSYGRHTFSATLSYAQRLPEEEPSYGYWAGRGYTGLLRDATPYLAPGPPRTASRGTGRIGASLAFPGRVQAHVSAGARSERGLYIERPAFQLRPGDAAVSGPVRVDPEAHGTSADARLTLDIARGVWRVHAFYSLLTDWSGSDSFRDAWDRVPMHRGGLALTAQPDPGFALRVAFSMQSATRWPGYAALEGAAEPRGYVYAEGTPSLAILDTSLEKGLWDRQLRLSLAFRNVLNTEERYHPLGAVLDYRLFLRVEASLQDLPVWR